MVKPTVGLVLCIGIAVGCSGQSDLATPTSGPAPGEPTRTATPADPLDGGAAKLTAAEIAAKVEKTYATCKTYRDTATVTSENYEPNLARWEDAAKLRQVKTAFERGGAIRFEYRDPDTGRGPQPETERVYIIWAKGEEVREWPEDRKPILKQDRSDPRFALRVLTGVTKGTSTKIPLMLLPNVDSDLKPEPGFTPLPETKQPATTGFAAEYRNAVRLPDGKIGGTNCYVLQHEMLQALNLDDYLTHQVTTFWIANTHLIRRVHTEIQIPPDRTKRMNIHGTRSAIRIDFAPAIDVALDPKELEFNPPK